MGLKHVKIITTGGTIASLPRQNGSVSASLSGAELVKRLGIEGNIEVQSSVTVGSYSLDYTTLYKLSEDVIMALEDPMVKGIVVTHGTDTIEETAYFLSLVTSGYEKPVMLTGAQLDASHAFSDGAKNLKDAISAVESQNSYNLGTCVVFGGFLYDARSVRKVDTNALEAFSSPGWGPIGRIDNQTLTLNNQSPKKVGLPLEIPRPVALIRLGLGLDGDEFRRMVEGYDGVVIEAFGRGNAHYSIPQVVKDLVDREVPVIITSRCIRGAVLPVYGNGGGKDLEIAGAWFAGDLAGEKARLLLGSMLANNMYFHEMRDLVDTHSQYNYI